MVRKKAVQIDNIPWKPFPDALSRGGIRSKMLHTLVPYRGCP
jgi:hypothetical protein